MRLDEKTMESVAIAISIAAGCEPCTKYHVKAAAKSGATHLEMMHMAALAGESRNDRTPIGLAIEEVRSLKSKDGGDESLGRNAALAGIGIAVCMNTVSLLQKSVEVAQNEGAVDEEIMEVIGLATRIKNKAASHLEKVIDRLDADPGIGRAAALLCT